MTMQEGREADARSGTGKDPWARFGWLMAVVWLVFLIYPVLALLASAAPPAWVVTGWVALVAFIVLYVTGFMHGMRGGGGLGRTPSRRQWFTFAALIACALITIPAVGGSALSFLPFIMSFASYGLTRAWHWITTIAALVVAAGCVFLIPDNLSYLSVLAIVALLGVVNTVSTWLIVRSAEAEQLGRELATSEGREAVARDVHDLIGHSLTVVGLKAQLVRRLMDSDPERAKAELADIERLTAEAIAGVRQTVAGARATTLVSSSPRPRTRCAPPTSRSSWTGPRTPSRRSRRSRRAGSSARRRPTRCGTPVPRPSVCASLRACSPWRTTVSGLRPGPGIARATASGDAGARGGGGRRIRRAAGRGGGHAGGGDVVTAAPMVPIRLLIADDQALVRGALGALLDLEPDLQVQGLAADGAEALRLAEELQPDVCLMDIQMPRVDGVEATTRIRAVSPQTRVLVVTTFARPGYLRAALDAGASGFVVKDTPAEELAAAVRRVHAGLRVLDPKLAEESLFEGANPLSDRERQVLRLAADGRSAAAIAAEVFLSAGTVRNHLSAAIGKTGAENRAQAVRIASDKGWL